MTALAGGLFAWAVLGVVAAPRLVADRAWSVRRPRLALSAWALLVLTVVAGAVTGLVLLLLSIVQLASAPTADLSTCDACQALAVFGAGWLATAVVGGLGGLALLHGLAMALERRGVRRLTRAVEGAAPRTSGRPGRSGSGVVYVDTDQHVAACGHRHGPVVVSTALRDLLSTTELATVIEHERSHLRQRHQLVASAARLQRACLPRLAATRSCERSVLLLVELAADDSAARRCGRDLTARTLTKVGLASADPAMQLRARRLQSA